MLQEEEKIKLKIMDVNIIEKHNSLKRGNNKISVRPYVNGKENMGLEKYDMVLFEGVVHEEPLACLLQNGIKRYVTGLNEFAPDVKNLPEDEKEAKIKQIRETVSQLEKELASNVIDPKDPDFWNKVQLLRPNNDTFWGKIIMRFGNEPIFLDPMKDPYDLIKLKAIEAGGFSLCAKSFEEAKNSGNKKFYLDKFEETVGVKTEYKKLRNKALAELQKLFDKNADKLFLVCKVLDANSVQYKKTTPLDVLYDNMDSYINGESADKNKKRTAQEFLNIVKLDMETLKLRALVKDATWYKVLATKPDGYIYHLKSSTMLGKNPSDIVEYLKNPLNEEILADLTKNVENYWYNG
jgi:hypothetical protein